MTESINQLRTVIQLDNAARAAAQHLNRADLAEQLHQHQPVTFEYDPGLYCVICPLPASAEDYGSDYTYAPCEPWRRLISELLGENAPLPR